MKKSRLSFIASLAVLAACGDTKANRGLGTATIDTLPGGIVRVTNSGPTAWTDTSGWQLVEERTIMPAEGSPGEIGNPGGLAAGADGSVYLLQTGPVGIKVYGPDGNWVRTIGREGDGPGEFRNGMFALVGDVLVIQDPNNTRMTTFSTNGEFLGTAVSQCCWWTSNFPVFDDGTIGILGPPPASHSDRQGALYITRMNGTVTDTILMPVRAPDQTPKGNWTVTRKTANMTSMMGVGIPLFPQDASEFTATRRKVIGNNGRYELAITGLRDDTLRIFSAPAPQLTITDAEHDSIFKATVETVAEGWRDAMREVAKAGDIPKSWPAWSEIAVDGTSHIWIGRPGPRGAVSMLDVFTPDGVLLGSVVPPDKGILDGYWTADRVYLQDSDANGLPRIRVFRIKKG